MAKTIKVVEDWHRKWGNRIMHADEEMSRARRTEMYNEVHDMVSIRNRTIAALIGADSTASHYGTLIADAKALIEEPA